MGVRRRELASALERVNAEDVEVGLTTLLSLGLLADEPVVREYQGMTFFSDSEEFTLSPLGRRFIAACERPSERAPDEIAD